MSKEANDRFGVPDERIIEVIRAYRALARDGCYVPTRREVAEAPADELWGWLLNWFWEKPGRAHPNEAAGSGGTRRLRRSV